MHETARRQQNICFSAEEENAGGNKHSFLPTPHLDCRDRLKHARKVGARNERALPQKGGGGQHWCGHFAEGRTGIWTRRKQREKADEPYCTELGLPVIVFSCDFRARLRSHRFRQFLSSLRMLSPLLRARCAIRAKLSGNASHWAQFLKYCTVQNEGRSRSIRL